MKRILIPVAVAVTVALAMASCNQSPDVKSSKHHRVSLDETIQVVTFKGHEYLIYDGYKAGSMCHSESCPCKKV
jgi:hypothetical protein